MIQRRTRATRSLRMSGRPGAVNILVDVDLTQQGDDGSLRPGVARAHREALDGRPRRLHLVRCRFAYR
jgi:hypothetical protein